VTGYFPAGSDFQAVQPTRLADTRQSVDSATVDGLFKGLGVLTAGSVMELPVAGRGGVPADASAVALNVTVTEAQGSGFVTVYPCGQPRPNASALNYVAGDTVANSVIVKIGAGGSVCLFTLGTVHLIADVTGYFPAGSAFQAVQPTRLLDTRGPSV